MKVPVIIDNGSGVSKCGLANEKAPSAVFPNVVGFPKYQEVMQGNCKDAYVGHSAQQYRGVLQMSYPLEHGIIKDWDSMEKASS